MSVSFRPMITVSSWHTLSLFLVANQSKTHRGFITTLSYHFFFFVQENMMCAQDMPGGTVSGDGKLAEQDTCQGDSGGPMILPSEEGGWEEDLQIGVGECFVIDHLRNCLRILILTMDLFLLVLS